MVAVALGVAGVVGGVASASAAGKAAKAQANAANDSMALQKQMFDQTREDAEPWRVTGKNALDRLSKELGLTDDAGFRETPGYQFAFKEGQRAVDNSGAARGMNFSGNQLRALNDYGQGMADQEYGNWLDRISNLSGVGQQTAAQGQVAGQNYANSMSDLMGQAGAARASGYVGTANAFNGVTNNLLKTYAYSKI